MILDKWICMIGSNTLWHSGTYSLSVGGGNAPIRCFSTTNKNQEEEGSVEVSSGVLLAATVSSAVAKQPLAGVSRSILLEKHRLKWKISNRS